jgi:preprotein translocase subunit SecG
MSTLLLVLWTFVSLFLILIILLQRGKGGGLAGALGGAGGSSAFGTKAGDVFTKITVGVFGFWLLLAMILVWSMKSPEKFKEDLAAKKDKDAASTAVDTSKDDSSKLDKSELNKKLEEMLKKDSVKGDEKAKETVTPPVKTGTDAAKETPKSDATKTEVPPPPPKKEAPKTDTKTPAPADAKTPPTPAKEDGKKS